MKRPERYHGWWITFNITRPLSGQWRAEKFGVGMCNSSYEALIRMIEQRFKDEQERHT